MDSIIQEFIMFKILGTNIGIVNDKCYKQIFISIFSKYL